MIHAWKEEHAPNRPLKFKAVDGPRGWHNREETPTCNS